MLKYVLHGSVLKVETACSNKVSCCEKSQTGEERGTNTKGKQCNEAVSSKISDTLA